MNTVKATMCVLGLLVFLVCLIQIRLYEPDFLKTSKIRPIGDTKANLLEVVIDPGHGGMDGGTVGEGVLEKDWALRMGTELARELRSRGREVLLTRDSDEALSLASRCAIANASDAKIFVSIHFNHSSDPTVSGVETFYSWPKSLTTVGALKKRLGVGRGVTLKDERSELLGAEVQQAIVSTSGARDRGVKNRRLWVTRNTAIPAILVECGFLSNRSERESFANKDYRQAVVGAIANGIEAYLDNAELSPMLGLSFEG